MAIKTEHNGAKNSGGFWGSRKDAKETSNSLRRKADRRIEQVEFGAIRMECSMADIWGHAFADSLDEMNRNAEERHGAKAYRDLHEEVSLQLESATRYHADGTSEQTTFLDMEPEDSIPYEPRLFLI